MKKATLIRNVRQGRLENRSRSTLREVSLDYRPLLITSLTRSPTRLL